MRVHWISLCFKIFSSQSNWPRIPFYLTLSQLSVHHSSNRHHNPLKTPSCPTTTMQIASFQWGTLWTINSSKTYWWTSPLMTQLKRNALKTQIYHSRIITQTLSLLILMSSRVYSLINSCKGLSVKPSNIINLWARLVKWWMSLNSCTRIQVYYQVVCYHSRKRNLSVMNRMRMEPWFLMISFSKINSRLQSAVFQSRTL